MATARLYPPEEPLHTAEELLAMGEDAPFILIEGRLVDEPLAGARNSRLAAIVCARLLEYVDPRQLGFVLGADGGFILQRDPDTVVAPDAAFVRSDRLPPPEQLGDSFVPVPPDLAVEVLSPSNRAGETARKVELYRNVGVPLVWVIDPEHKTATVYARGHEPVTIGLGATLHGGEVLPGFSLPLDDVFG